MDKFNLKIKKDIDRIFNCVYDDILDILREYGEGEQNTILMPSHIISDLDKTADYIGFIHKGKIVFVKSYDEIRESYGTVKYGRNIFYIKFISYIKKG